MLSAMLDQAKLMLMAMAGVLVFSLVWASFAVGPAYLVTWLVSLFH